MTDRDDREIEDLAAEYVLGTLDAEERAAVAARRMRDPGLDRAITAWERRLAPMMEAVKDAPPPADAYDAIRDRIAGPAAPAVGPRATPALALSADDDPRRGSSAQPQAGRGAEVARLRRGLAVWRGLALAASLAFAALVGTLIYKPELLPAHQGDRRFVAVFQDGDQAPRFLLSLDLKSRQVTIRPVAAAPAPDKAYQLWIVAAALGPKPQSLGLLDGLTRPTRKSLAGIAPAVLEGALFGISLEPAGGSPTGEPTGPALHGKLIPTTAGAE